MTKLLPRAGRKTDEIKLHSAPRAGFRTWCCTPRPFRRNHSTPKSLHSFETIQLREYKIQYSSLSFTLSSEYNNLFITPSSPSISSVHHILLVTVAVYSGCWSSTMLDISTVDLHAYLTVGWAKTYSVVRIYMEYELWLYPGVE